MKENEGKLQSLMALDLEVERSCVQNLVDFFKLTSSLQLFTFCPPFLADLMYSEIWENQSLAVGSFCHSWPKRIQTQICTPFLQLSAQASVILGNALNLQEDMKVFIVLES